MKKNPRVQAAAKAPVAPPTAKPGEKGPEQAQKAPKAPKVKKVPWGTRDAEGQLVEKISKKPADFDPKKNSPLRRKDFASLADFLDFRADEAEVHVKDLRQLAADERAGVGKVTKGKQKRLLKLKDQYEALMAELRAAGVDVDAAMALQANAKQG